MTGSGAVHAVMVPGADALVFTEDVVEAKARGVVPHPLTVPKPAGHPVDDIRSAYEGVAAMIEAEIAAIRAVDAKARIVGIGRNRGGSLLAWHAARHDIYAALVFVGAIPDLARFRMESGHKGARQFRASLPDAGEVPRIAETAALDLTRSLESIRPDHSLLQVGRQDDWMDEKSFAVFRALEPDCRVQWVDDGHAMVSPAALAGRWDFIAQVAGS